MAQAAARKLPLHKEQSALPAGDGKARKRRHAAQADGELLRRQPADDEATAQPAASTELSAQGPAHLATAPSPCEALLGDRHLVEAMCAINSVIVGDDVEMVYQVLQLLAPHAQALLMGLCLQEGTGCRSVSFAKGLQRSLRSTRGLHDQGRQQ